MHENGVQDYHEQLIALLRLLSRPTPHTSTTLTEIQTDITQLTAAIQQLSQLSTEHRASNNATFGAANNHRYVTCRNNLMNVITTALTAHRYWHDREETENVPVSDRLIDLWGLVARMIRTNSGFALIAGLDQKLTETLEIMQHHRTPRAARSFTQQVDYHG